VAKEAGEHLTFSTPWEKIKEFDLIAAGAKENFPRELYKFFDPKWSIECWSYSFKVFTGYTKPETLTYRYPESMTIRTLWERVELVRFVKNLQGMDASHVVVWARGWEDSSYLPVYDDPSNDTRTLFKLHAQLLPGANTLYFAPGGLKTSATSYSTTLVMESKPTSERTGRFHNSTLEQSCTSCHEGLPSADGGATMKADCAVCHKAKTTATYTHAPAEMKECVSCHSWSAEAKTVVVEKGIPAVCYDCHDTKQQQVESSPVPHPVAGECLTCHSPHGTGRQHLLKEGIFDLCSSCHEDAKLNHPVGRHPARYAKLKDGEEISCVSCHNPHGSPYKSLLKTSSIPMETCADCHDK
jgi:predicted CXXCH cytochrome family protein